MLIDCIYAYVCPTCAGQTTQTTQTEIRRDQLPGTRVTTSDHVDTGNGARTSALNYWPISPAFLPPSVLCLFVCFCFAFYWYCWSGFVKVAGIPHSFEIFIYNVFLQIVGCCRWILIFPILINPCLNLWPSLSSWGSHYLFYFSLLKMKDIFNMHWCFACMCVCVRVPHPLKLELQAVVAPIWVLAIESKSNTPNHTCILSNVLSLF